ncbi:MAG: asparaginase [Planctomycetes bacterium]|nr:asparaginase [Planctomycetota bacterium]
MSLPLSRRAFVGGSAGLAASCASAREVRAVSSAGRKPVMVGSENALPGMQAQFEHLLAGGAPLDAAIEVCKVAEADPKDTSVGLGGTPNEDGVVQLDAACMDGRIHKSGAVAAIEDILHPIEVARIVLERTDHCQIFGADAYRFARAHGFPHTELLTEESRAVWMKWKEGLSDQDDRLGPPPAPPKSAPPSKDTKTSFVPARFERHGTIHCSVLALDGNVACATSTSGLAFKIPGRVGDSAIVGAGLYCDGEAGSAGSTGRGEASILACASAMIVEQLRNGRAPKDAGMEILRRIVRETERQALWQPALIGPDGRPSFDIQFYIVALDGSFAGVTLKGKTHARFAVSEPDGGPRLEALEALLT